MLISDENRLMSAEIKGCVSRDLYILLDLLRVSYNSAKFHYCRICVTNIRKGAFLPSPLSICEHQGALQLLTIMEEWTEILERGKLVDVDYFDFQEAFNTVLHWQLT